MAQQVITSYVDDLDGSVAVGTVKFALNNRAYEIDLSDENTDKLHEALAPFIEHARKASANGSAKAATAGAGRSQADRERIAEIRTWALANGHEVAPRGRIPKAVVEAYNAAH